MTVDEARRAPCPTCGADIGEPCTTQRLGPRRSNHAQRADVAAGREPRRSAREKGTNPRAKGTNPRATDPLELSRRFDRLEAAAARQRAHERRHRYATPQSSGVADLLDALADRWSLTGAV